MLQTNSNLAAILLTTIAIVVSACASQMDPDPDINRPVCPRNLILKCYKRTAQPAECRCVSQDDVERTFEKIIGQKPY
jgi:hypothetical protein